MLSLTKSGLTFPEQSTPALQWILWQHEQPLETELQSLARIHPSHLKEKCKWGAVLAQKEKKFYFESQAKQVMHKTHIKVQVGGFCFLQKKKKGKKKLPNPFFFFHRKPFFFWKLKCFSTSNTLKHTLLLVPSQKAFQVKGTIKQLRQLSSGHATHCCRMRKKNKKTSTTLRIHKWFGRLHSDEIHLVV